jgi:hypothetical protein
VRGGQPVRGLLTVCGRCSGQNHYDRNTGPVFRDLSILRTLCIILDRHSLTSADLAGDVSRIRPAGLEGSQSAGPPVARRCCPRRGPHPKSRGRALVTASVLQCRSNEGDSWKPDLRVPRLDCCTGPPRDQRASAKQAGRQLGQDASAFGRKLIQGLPALCPDIPYTRSRRTVSGENPRLARQDPHFWTSAQIHLVL